MRQEWEYRVSRPKIEQHSNRNSPTPGAEGWELVSVTAMFNTMMTKVVYTLFLKRPGRSRIVRGGPRASGQWPLDQQRSRFSFARPTRPLGDLKAKKCEE